ncbi:MAG: NfeD family protein [Methylococcaceae bacterium]
MNGLSIVFWHWWVLGMLLLVIELIAPFFFFLWLSIPAFLMGALLLAMPTLSVAMQFVIYSILSIIFLLISRVYLRKTPKTSDKPFLNQRSAQFIGRIFTLEEPIINGLGKIKVDDSIWKITGNDCSVQTKVKVVEVDGTVLKVIKIE